MTPYDDQLRASIRHHLDAHGRTVQSDDDRRHAAVAIVLVDSVPGEPPDLSEPGDEPEHGMEDLAGGAAFLLSRRAAKLRQHSGQWALPGGRIDEGEDAVTAALRELDEEVALRLDESHVLGLLDDYPTRSGFVITPVVVWAGGAVRLAPDPSEVRGVYRIALDELARDDSPRFIDIPESDKPVVQIPLGKFLLHAPTAAIMVQFRRVALDGDVDARVIDLEQPVWAWK
ncbi:MAG: CoA pyrophosphatase [Actinomycetota bacterium]|nr:CoA pyrophosphatase [Actinomycetota bacterium]